MKFNIFSKKPTHLYADLAPGERIDKLFVEFVFPVLERRGFKYLKSKREFKKKNDFFDFRISWYGRKYNEGNISVEFDVFITIFSPKYRKWETEFYRLDKNWQNAIDGGRADYIDGWHKEYGKRAQGLITVIAKAEQGYTQVASVEVLGNYGFNQLRLSFVHQDPGPELLASGNGNAVVMLPSRPDLLFELAGAEAVDAFPVQLSGDGRMEVVIAGPTPSIWTPR